MYILRKILKILEDKNIIINFIAMDTYEYLQKINKINCKLTDNIPINNNFKNKKIKKNLINSIWDSIVNYSSFDKKVIQQRSIIQNNNSINTSTFYFSDTYQCKQDNFTIELIPVEKSLIKESSIKEFSTEQNTLQENIIKSDSLKDDAVVKSNFVKDDSIIENISENKISELIDLQIEYTQQYCQKIKSLSDINERNVIDEKNIIDDERNVVNDDNNIIAEKNIIDDEENIIDVEKNIIDDDEENTIDVNIDNNDISETEDSADEDLVKNNKENIVKFNDIVKTLELSFPYPSIREQQQYILDKLKLCDNKKYIIIEAMPGVGKSAIALTIAKHFNSAYILTSTKVLQDQYENEFPNDLKLVKGKSNYMCIFNPKLPCNLAECVDNPKILKLYQCKSMCPYMIARHEAATNPITVTSYAFFFTWLEKNTEFRPRKILICDEAHLFASHVINWATINLHLPTLDKEIHILNKAEMLMRDCNEKDDSYNLRKESFEIVTNFKFNEDGLTDNNKNFIHAMYVLIKYKLSVLDKIFTLIDSIEDKAKKETYQKILYNSNWNIDNSCITPDIQDMTKELQEIVLLKKVNNNIQIKGKKGKGNKRRSEILQLKEKLTQLVNNLNNFLNNSSNYNKYVVYVSKHKDQRPILNIKPMQIDHIFYEYINNYGIDHIIFMSATILSAKLFCNDFGITQDQVNIIRVDSSFDPKKAPIYYSPVSDMAYKNFIDNKLKARLTRKIVQKVNAILDLYPNQRGIIHTSNYNIASIIKDNINNPRLIKKREFETNEQLLARHIKLENSVLVSPSLNTGADLKDDLSRFQIVIKLPFISLADKAVKIRAEQDPEWYVCDMLKTLIQSCGRSIRSEDDFASTYILDASFYLCIKRYYRWLPNSFMQRIIWNDPISIEEDDWN